MQAIVASNGVIGLNLYKGFLTLDKTATAEDALRHIDYFLTLGAKDHLALGCDMDGTAPLPDGMEGVGDLPKLYEKLADRLGSYDLVDAVFYENAKRALSRIL